MEEQSNSSYRLTPLNPSINDYVTISHDLVQCTQTSNNLNNAPEHFSIHVTSPRLTTGHVKHSEAYKLI